MDSPLKPGGWTDGWACRSLHGGNPLFFRHGLKLCETVCQTRRFLAHSSTQSGRSEVLLPLVRGRCPIAETLIHCLAMLEVGWIFFFAVPSPSSADCANELQFNCYVCHQDQNGSFGKTTTTTRDKAGPCLEGSLDFHQAVCFRPIEVETSSELLLVPK